MLFTYEYIIRDEGREGVRHNEYIMRLQALHTNYFRCQSGGYHYSRMCRDATTWKKERILT